MMLKAGGFVDFKDLADGKAFATVNAKMMSNENRYGLFMTLN